MTWLARTPFTLPFYWAVALSQKEYEAQLKQDDIPLSVSPVFLAPGVAGTCHLFKTKSSSKGEETTIILCFDMEDMIADDANGRSTIIAHEVVHVWQKLVEIMGEDEPSDEFMAWTIQHMTYRITEVINKKIAKYKANKKRARKAKRTRAAKARAEKKGKPNDKPKKRRKTKKS